jgi:ATP-dependent Zn protease
MDPDFITYQKFNDVALAENLVDILQRHNIEYTIEEESLTFNPSFVLNNELAQEYAVKINSRDFEQVNRLLLEEETANIDDVEADYYLFKFTNDELIDLLTKADEWSAFDYLLAQKILTDRGITVDDKYLEELKEKRIEELKEPEAPQTTWVVVGYMAAFLGGILGIFIGWYLLSSQKTLPNGEKVYNYNDRDRKNGRNIFYLSIIIFAIATIVKVFEAYNFGY